jgi:3-hydroxyacyl-CoA dehydrogenase/enoyl-CoA hydratase/carnithine racemase
MTPIRRHHRTLAVEWLADRVVVLRLFVPKSGKNMLTDEVLPDLAAALDELDAGPEPFGVILSSGRSGVFSAGMDVGRLAGMGSWSIDELSRHCAAGRAVLSRLSVRPWPSVAVVDGLCLGAGLEIALACDLRVATSAPPTALGFPDVKLGMLPGWGGTVRAPRLVGVAPAVELLAGGETISGGEALRLGLVDACVADERAIPAARALMETARTTRSHLDLRRQRERAVGIEPDELASLEAAYAEAIRGRTGGRYPAPPTILRTVVAGAAVTAGEAAAIETGAFVELARSGEAAALVRLFRLGERNSRDSGLDAIGDVEPREIAAPAVVGGGIMGAGIAACGLRAGFRVAVVDVDPGVLAAGSRGILEEAAWDRSTRRADPARAVALAGRLTTGTTLAPIAAADLVIESVVERTDIKRRVLAQIERAVRPATLIATNTSTNPIGTLAESLLDPTRFCGMHFFNPVRRMTLVEVVRGPRTSDATVAAVVAHAKRLGKCPIVVRDSPGFLVNRILMPYLHEAVELLREGVDMRRIDRAARGFGMPLGPIELYDLIGLDTAFYAGLVMASAFGDRIDASPAVPALVKSGRLGRKTGGGFYRYRVTADGNAQQATIERPDESIGEILSPYALPDTGPSDATIIDRLVIPMLLEAILAIDEGIVRDPRDVDLAVVHALGFPAFRGGLLAWADALGPAEILRRLEPLAFLGPRMTPPRRLLDLARTGARLAAD